MREKSYSMRCGIEKLAGCVPTNYRGAKTSLKPSTNCHNSQPLSMIIGHTTYGSPSARSRAYKHDLQLALFGSKLSPLRRGDDSETKYWCQGNGVHCSVLFGSLGMLAEHTDYFCPRRKFRCGVWQSLCGHPTISPGSGRSGVTRQGYACQGIT